MLFQDEASASYWLEQILKNQGFDGGRRICQYKPLNKIGEGSFGQVIQAKHRCTSSKYAVKIIEKEILAETFDKYDIPF